MQTFSRKSGSDDIDIADRVVASLPYLLPLFDSLRYGTLCAVGGGGGRVFCVVRVGGVPSGGGGIDGAV